MRDAVDRIVGPFLSQVDSVLGNGYSAVLYGSAARADFAPGRSDLNLTDMRCGYEVLRGADPVAGLHVAPADLRQALEREFRGKLLRLRQGYVAAGGDPAALGLLAGRSSGTFLVLLRALLVLLGRPVPSEPVEVAAAAAAALGIDGEPLLNVVRHRAERGWRCSPGEFEGYLDAVSRATTFLDQLQLGDLR
jgi:hypothetical protein